MQIIFKDNLLMLDDVVTKVFTCKISEILKYDKVIIVRLDSKEFLGNENVFAITYNGNVEWQIPKFDYGNDKSPYISIHKINDQDVKIFNWDSSFVVLEANSGKVIIDPLSSRKGRRPW